MTLGQQTTLKMVETPLPGVFIVEPDVKSDSRGFFMETYHREKFASIGISDLFVQDNHSRSTRGVVRGLHYQLRHPQAKLCRVIAGEIFDVAVDIRLGSPTFGKWTSALLSAENKLEFYVPSGFAHGFEVLSANAELLYKCSDFYDPTDDLGIAWNDPDLDIGWKSPNPLLSERDKSLPRLTSLPANLLPRYGRQ